MRTLLRTIALSTVMTLTAVLPSSWLLGQSAPEPAAVISMAPMSRQLGDIGYLAKAAGMGQMEGMVKIQIESFLKGVDFSRPSGALVYFDEGNPQPRVVAFVPVKNLDDLINTISQFAEVEDGDKEGSYTIMPDNGPPMHVREADGFAFVTDDEGNFEGLPSSPAQLLGDLPTSYNMSAKIFVQRIPADLRENVISMIEQGYKDQLENMGEDATAELQMQNFEMQMAQIRSYINETNELVVGFAADKAAQNLHFAMQMVGNDGSELARQAKAYGDSKGSRFAGFLMEGAAFNANSHAVISAQDAKQYHQMLEQLQKQAFQQMEVESEMSEEELELAQKVMGQLIASLNKTIDAGVVDLGATLMLKDESANLAIGMQVADPQDVEKMIKDLVAEMSDKIGDAMEIHLDEEKHSGITMHRIVVPLPPDADEAMSTLVGESATILLGFGNNAAYLAAGKNPGELLKQAVDESASKTKMELPPGQYNLYLSPILRTIGEVQDETMMTEMAEKLSTNGRDRVQFLMKTIPNGMHFRLEIQDGILELIGVAGQMFGGMAPGADFE